MTIDCDSGDTYDSGESVDSDESVFSGYSGDSGEFVWVVRMSHVALKNLHIYVFLVPYICYVAAGSL